MRVTAIPPEGESGWTEGLDAEELADVLRSTLHESYADASDDEMEDALANVLDSLSPAEAFNFGSALNRIGKSASRVVSDPAFVSVARTALPVLGGAAGTLIGGPAGTAVGGKLGSLAASALPTPPRPAPVTARPAAAAASCTGHTGRGHPASCRRASTKRRSHYPARRPAAAGLGIAGGGWLGGRGTGPGTNAAARCAAKLAGDGTRAAWPADRQRCSCRTGTRAAEPGIREGGRGRR